MTASAEGFPTVCSTAHVRTHVYTHFCVHRSTGRAPLSRWHPRLPRVWRRRPTSSSPPQRPRREPEVPSAASPATTGCHVQYSPRSPRRIAPVPQIVMAKYGYGLYSYGVCSYGLCSYRVRNAACPHARTHGCGPLNSHISIVTST